MRNRLLVAMFIPVLVAATAPAGSLSLNQVGKSANWVVHLDADLFKASTIGTMIRGELANLGVEQKLAEFAYVFGFHPLNDLRDVTLYGTGPDKNKAVVLIDAAFKVDQVLSILGMNPEYQKTSYGDFVIHRWVDENKLDASDPSAGITYGSFFNDGLAVLGPSQDGVKGALDVLSGTAGGADAGTFAQSELRLKGAFIQVAANRVDELAGDEPQAQMLKQAKELGVAVGESAGSFFIEGGLTANSEDAAINLNKMMDGLLAFAMLASAEQPKLAELAQKVQTSRVQDTLRVRFETPAESLVALLKELWQMQQAKAVQ